MNSNPQDSTQPTLNIPLGKQDTQPTSLSPTSSPSFADDPLDSLLDKKVHEMSSEELVEFVKRCSLMRSSAQTRKAAVRAEGPAPKKPSAKSKSNIDAALALLQQLNSL